MTHGRFAKCFVVLAFTLCLVTLPSCHDDGPKRRGPQNYREYRAAFDPRYPAQDEAASGPTDNGSFGPASGTVDVLSADDVAAGRVPNAGTLKGTIKYAGKAVNRKVINTSKTPFCVQAGEIKTEDLVVSDQGGLKNVLVHVSRGFIGYDFQPFSKARLVDQIGCRYVPHVVAAMAGQELAVRNSDNTSHNYHFTGIANDEINKTQPSPTTDSVFLSEPELGASFACDIHPWMRAPVYVLSHPYFAVTSDDGSFEIKGLPPGTYEISFEHERGDMKCAPQTVTIEAGKTAVINAEFRR